MEKKLINLIKANTKLIQIISYETHRIHGMLIRTANELNKDFFVWNRVEGIKKWNKEKRSFEIEVEDKQQPETVLDFFKEKLQINNVKNI